MGIQLAKKERQVIIYLQASHFRRLATFQDGTGQKEYFDDNLTERAVKNSAQNCYQPVNAMLSKLILANPKIRLCLSITGETINLLERYSPEALAGFVALSKTGAVEFLGETFYHSLASLLSPEEFRAQAALHTESIQRHFGLKPTVFRNTELIHNDQVGQLISSMGFTGVLCEGSRETIGDNPTGLVYNLPQKDFGILLRNAVLSEEISHRFGAGNAVLTTSKFLEHLGESYAGESQMTLCGFSYDMFGDPLHKQAGFVEFFEELLKTLSGHSEYEFTTPSEILTSITARKELPISKLTSWSEGKDTSDFLGNDAQQEAFELLKTQTDKINQVADESLIDIWRNLQSSDHFKNMSTTKGRLRVNPDSPYVSPHEAFNNYMNILKHFSLNLQNAPVKQADNEHAKTLESERQHLTTPMWAMGKESQQRTASEIH